MIYKEGKNAATTLLDQFCNLAIMFHSLTRKLEYPVWDYKAFYLDFEIVFVNPYQLWYKIQFV